MDKFQRIDELLLPDHTFIHPEDLCLFYGEYTVSKKPDASGQKIPPYKLGQINQLIYNFKKPVRKKGQPEYQYKLQAIEDIARILYDEFKKIVPMTWVPIPPSKERAHPDYDDRVEQVLKRFKELDPRIDVRNLVEQVVNRKAMHEGEEHRSPDILYMNYKLNESLLEPVPLRIAIFDDVLCTGASFQAIKRLLSEKIKDVKIVGVFVARRVPDAAVI